MKKKPRTSQAESNSLKPNHIDPIGIFSWSHSHPIDSKGKLAPIQTAENFKMAYRPLTMSYYNPLPSCFSFEISQLPQLDSSSDWFFRDGAVSLMHFFSRFSHPQKLKSHIYVHESLLGLTPKAWQPYVRGYHSAQSPIDHARIESLYVIGFASYAFLSPSRSKEYIQELKNLISSLPNFKKLKMFLPLQFNSQYDSGVFHGKLFFQLRDEFGTAAELLDWEGMVGQTDYSKSHLIGLFDQNFIADPSAYHWFWQRGTSVHNVPSMENIESLDIALSENHGFIFNEKPNFEQATELAKKNFKHLLSDPLYYALPWPKWLQQNS